MDYERLYWWRRLVNNQKECRELLESDSSGWRRRLCPIVIPFIVDEKIARLSNTYLCTRSFSISRYWADLIFAFYRQIFPFNLSKILNTFLNHVSFFSAVFQFLPLYFRPITPFRSCTALEEIDVSFERQFVISRRAIFFLKRTRLLKRLDHEKDVSSVAGVYWCWYLSESLIAASFGWPWPSFSNLVSYMELLHKEVSWGFIWQNQQGQSNVPHSGGHFRRIPSCQ